MSYEGNIGTLNKQIEKEENKERRRLLEEEKSRVEENIEKLRAEILENGGELPAEAPKKDEEDEPKTGFTF